MKVLGYVLGLLLLANGTAAAITSRWWTELEWPFVERFVTREEASAIREFKKIPGSTLRSWGLWESAFGLLVMALASRISGMERAFT